MKRRWLILPIVLLVLVTAVMILFLTSSARLSIGYSEKNVLESEQSGNAQVVEAWSQVSGLTAACEESWRGQWPDWFGGFGVVENEGEYLTNVYLTRDTEENRRAVCEAAGASLRAYTTTDVSWNELKATLRRVDGIKSFPGVHILGMGIQIERRCVRVYLSHQDVLTTIALGMVRGPLEVVIIPVTPNVRSAVRNPDGTVSLEVGGLTYSDAVTLELSTDAAFEENVKTVECDDNDASIHLPDPGEGSAWYVRAKAFKTAEGTTYISEWSAAKTIKDAE